MTVLVTGGAGYIGSHTCLELLTQGYSVIAVDNFSNSKAEAVSRVKQLAKCDFAFYQTDLRDKNALDDVFSKHDISIVIHFAGLKAVGESVVLPLEYYGNNINSTITLCEVMKKHNVNRIIFSSSATVYSGDNEMPLTETSKTGYCANPYAWTKHMGEQILCDAANANENLSVIILRYFNPIGAHESGSIGEDPADTPNNLMPYVAQIAVGRREYLSIFGDDYPTTDGTGVRDYIHVTDLVKGHVAAINYAQNHTGSEVFNLGTGSGISVFEFVKAFEEVSGRKIPYQISPRRQGDLPISYAAIDKARDVLGWTAEKTIAEACADSWRWQSMNPMGYQS